MIQTVPQPHTLQHFLSVRPVRPAWTETHAEHDIFQHRKTLEQIKRLKHIADLPRPQLVAARLTQRRHLRAVEHHAPAVRRENAGNQVQKCRFPRAAFSTQRHLFSRRERERFDAHDLHPRPFG